MEDLQLSLSRQQDLDHAGNCTTTIPFDLIIEILSLLPAKSLIRFQSVSKLWLSTIRSRPFVHSFRTRSKARPRLLFTFDHRESRRNFIFSAPEYVVSDDYKYSIVSVMARYHMTISHPDYNIFCSSVNGFICFLSAVSCPYLNSPPLSYSITVYNPTTRQIVKLPDFASNGRRVDARLGYDPVEDQYKVLCVMMLLIIGPPESQDDIQQEHFVCTLSSSQKQEWRKIENPAGDSYRCVFYGQICIDGALYYGVGESRIVRFDVRSEKVDYIKTPEESHISASYNSALINYNGKLGGLERCCTRNLMTLWVLEDAEKQEWSSMTYKLPNDWDASLGYGVTTDVEIHGDHTVFCPPFSVLYYDFELDCISLVRIRGIEDGDLRLDGFSELNGYTSCWLGYIENIKFL